VALLTIGVVAVAAPWLGLRDPAAQPGGSVLQELPPASRADAIRLADGSVQYADEVQQRSDGSVSYRKGDRWESLPVERLAGADEASWRRRPFFLLGTDEFGRDVLSRLVHGARVSLWVGLLAAAMAIGIGAGVGLLAGFAGGVVDSALMRLTDVALALPRLFFAVLLVSLYGRSLGVTIVVLGVTTWMAAARIVRGQILSLKQRDFIHAARAAGASPWRTMLAHLLPGTLGAIRVEGTLRVADAILLEAALSFMQLGVQPPRPSWGNLIYDGRHLLLDAWWISLFPGVAVAATVVALQRLGDTEVGPATGSH
jgi:peptide/nickel transport system permease protein